MGNIGGQRLCAVARRVEAFGITAVAGLGHRVAPRQPGYRAFERGQVGFNPGLDGCRVCAVGDNV